jgi:hypothetical protein
MSLPQTDAGKMLHEIMHINLISQDRPHIFDRVFNGLHAYTAPTVAAWVASGASVKDVINNADSHTQFANGIYWENTFGYLPPPDQPKALTSTKECIGGGGTYSQFSVHTFANADFCFQIATSTSKTPTSPNAAPKFSRNTARA